VNITADSSLTPALIGLGDTITGSAIVLTGQFPLERKKQEAGEKKEENREIIRVRGGTVCIRRFSFSHKVI
jgi:hypothetical protein